MDPDAAVFVITLKTSTKSCFAYYFLKVPYIYIIFQRPVTLTYGSWIREAQNIWILGVRIRNTG